MLQNNQNDPLYRDLGFQNVQHVVLDDAIDINAIVRKTLLQPSQIKRKLLENQKLIISQFMQPYSKLNLNPSDNFKLVKFFPNNWKNNPTFWPQRIEMQQIYEVTGKSGTGKTFFCYCLLEQGLSKGKNVYVFDTSNNFSPSKLHQWFGGQFINKYKKSIKRFQVSTLKQLGQQIFFLTVKLQQYDMPSVIIIDCLSHLIDTIPFSQNSSAFFGLRKQFFSLIQATNSCILYTTLSHQSLFMSSFQKPQEERFKNIHATMWESLTPNGILLDCVLEYHEVEKKVMRMVKLCLFRSGNENRFAEFQCVQN